MYKYLALLIFLYSSAYAECVLHNNTVLYTDQGRTPAWEVSKHMPLSVIKKQSIWSKVKAVDGYAYWIKNSSLTNKHQCVVVKVKNINLRVGPSIKDPHHKFRIADKYTAFKVIIKQKSWLFVESDIGFKAWLTRSSVWPSIK